MKIIVVHGEDTAKSYERLTTFINSAKERGWDIVTDAIPETPSLFGTQRLIIIRDYKLLGKKELKKISVLEGTLVIYHAGLIPQAFIKSLPPATKTEKFDLPKMLFVFLESLSPRNELRSLKLLHDLSKNTPIELVFFMTSRHFRDLYWVLTDQSAITPAWRASKLKSQANKFGAERLKILIGRLSEIDIEAKTGISDLTSALDLFIIKNLQ